MSFRCSDFNPAPVEHFAGGADAVQGAGKTRVHSHLDDDFDDLLRRAADVERPLDMDLQLRLRIAQRGEGGNGGQLARAQRQGGAREHVAVGKIDDPVAQFGRQVAQRIDH